MKNAQDEIRTWLTATGTQTVTQIVNDVADENPDTTYDELMQALAADLTESEWQVPGWDDLTEDERTERMRHVVSVALIEENESDAPSEMNPGEYHDKYGRERNEHQVAGPNGYYVCQVCGYSNSDIKDVAEEPCWNCGTNVGLERRS